MSDLGFPAGQRIAKKGNSSEDSSSGEGAVQKLDYVSDFLMGLVNLHSCPHLQQAAWIGRDDDRSARRARVLHLFGQNLE